MSLLHALDHFYRKSNGNAVRAKSILRPHESSNSNYKTTASSTIASMLTFFPRKSTCIARGRRSDPLSSHSLPTNFFCGCALAYRPLMLDQLLPSSFIHRRTQRRKNFISLAFKNHASSFAKNITSIPVKALHSISTVERYHTLVRKAYRIVRSETPDLHRNTALQIAIKATNESNG